MDGRLVFKEEFYWEYAKNKLLVFPKKIQSLPEIFLSLVRMAYKYVGNVLDSGFFCVFQYPSRGLQRKRLFHRLQHFFAAGLYTIGKVFTARFPHFQQHLLIEIIRHCKDTPPDAELP